MARPIEGQLRLDGTTYYSSDSDGRKKTQVDRVREAMWSGVWRTPQEISVIANVPEGSVTSRLRDLRTKKFGGFDIKRRYRGEPKDQLFEYRLTRKDIDIQMSIFEEGNAEHTPQHVHEQEPQES